ncbi:bolA-like protein 1 [Myzus persicae]|uniref:bolA-like protein 1 n=1 Tax=Myzus persicae TaxID=13164 RepID=UPI000B936CDF|nr:bolA-like protein 1 [Myzus persicae]
MMSTASKCVESCIRTKLQNRFNPKVLQLINESHMHNVPKDSETHFKVVIVSDEFEGMPLIKRHRLVNAILTDELKSGVHALSIVAKAPTQWKDEPIESSPNCRGGFGK